MMAASRESFFVKFLLFSVCCSSTTVIICHSQGFTCFSSIDCHGNKIGGDISMISECCAIGAGLSFEESTGECGNCFTDEKFEGQGEKFYLGIFNNHEPSEYFRIARIRLAVEPEGRESILTTFMVDALGDQTVYTAPSEVTLDSRMLELESVGTRNRGIFIKSETSVPLSVVAFVEEFQSSDTFKVYPCVAQPVAAYEYYAVSIPQSFILVPPDPDYPQDEPEVLDPQGNSAIVIVTTEENTVLNVTLTQDVSISQARDIVEQIGTDLLRSGEQVSFQISGTSRTLYLASLDDLTGSHVTSNKPIAFITGHECGTLPHNIRYCDHLVEQITPTSTWGKEFIISTIATRREVDTFRIIASRSDTSVSIACTITDVPPLIDNLTMAGSYVEFHVNSTDSCYLESNQPILVAQFSVSSLVDKVDNSDPFLVIVPSIEQYRSSYVFNTFTGSPFNPGVNYINILLPAGVEVEGLRIDGGTVPDDATVTSILCPDSDTICATTVQVGVSDDRHNLNHIDSSAQFSAIVYWLSFRVAHGYSIGMTQNPIALPSVSLERSNYIVFENDSVVVLQLIREGDTSVPATVFINTAEITNGGNALSGEDFVVVSQLAVDFRANQIESFVTIDIVDDVFPESAEVFEVFLSASPGVYIVSPAYANVTIFNDDPPIPVMNVSFAETNIEVMEGVGLVMLTLEKTFGALGPVTVRIFTNSESAIDGEDFVAIDDIITFEIEDLTATVLVLVLDNLSVEDIEEFTVHIEPVLGDFPVAVQNSTSTVSIRDNDVVVLGFEQPMYTVSEENDGEFRVSVIISHGSLERSIIATVETISGSAIENEDFVPVTRVLSFDSTTTEQSIGFSLINDNQVEVNEELNIRLVLEDEDSSNIITSPVEAVITILDTDRVEIDLLPIATTVREGEGSARVNVSVTEGKLGGPVSVALTTFSINSTSGDDYADVSTEITLSPSNSFQEVLISIIDDTVYDGPDDEKFLISATLMPGQRTERVDVQVSSQTITILDNEPAPIALVGFSEASYTTGEDAREIVLLVKSDGINHDLITVDFFLNQTGEAQDGSDIIFPAGSLQFPPGSRTGVITVPIIDDGRAELAETFTVQLRTRSRDAISLMTDSATVTIIDNDAVNIGFGQIIYSVTEGQNAAIVLTITKTSLSDRTVSVMFSTLDGTALAGIDYEGLTQTLTFPPNVNTREVTVRILNNQLQEPGSRLFLGELRSVSSTGVNISLPTASILIADDDLSIIPSRPINFEAIPQATVVEFTWEQPSVDMVDNYVLILTYLSPCERGSPHTLRILLDRAARQYTLEGLEESSTYSFNLQARNSAGFGPDAALEVVTLTAAPSGPPQSLRGVSTTPTSITIEWNDIICLDQNGAITSYDVCVNGKFVLTSFQRQATITGLSPSTSYFIDVRGNNSIGGGPFSTTAVIMTTDIENVTISFDESEYTVREGETVSVGVRLSGPVSVQTVVGLLTVDGTAEESEDYILSDAIVTFAPGEIVQFIPILTVNDNSGESDETFDIVFSPISPNVNVGAIPSSSIVIMDDTRITCESNVVLQSSRITCTSTRPLSQNPPSLCVIGTTEGFCDISNFVVTTDEYSAGNLNLTITARDRQGFVIVHTFPFVLIECEPLGAVRLVGGSNAMEGRVEVCDGVVWGTVCDDQWDNQDAMVVCRQLGFPTQGAIARTEAFFGQGSGPIVLDDVQCTGSETRILDCTANVNGVHNCIHEDDAGVTCLPSPTTPPDELVECFVDQNCQRDATPLLVTRRDCCVLNQAGVGFRRVGEEACDICVVFGFFQTIFTAFEQGQGFAVQVGYLKRPQTGVVALPFTVTQELLGTATMADFTLQTGTVAVLPTQASRDVIFTFNVDRIAQELDETVRLKLSVSQSVLNRLPGELNNSVYFIDTADLVIVDSDTLDLYFTNDDYRSSEPELSIPVRVTKNRRIATPVTVRVTPLTLTQHRLRGRPDLPGTLEDNPNSPIEADLNDFNNAPVLMVFQPDETGQKMIDIDTPIPIVDDITDEATEQNFVVTLDIASAVDTSRITSILRDAALCRIIDDDDVAIGFQQPSYTFSEPRFSEDIVGVVLLEKENSVVSEQTFFIFVTVAPTTPNQAIAPAEQSMRGFNDNDYTIGAQNFVSLIMNPVDQTIPFNFRLFGDDIVEPTEAFQAISTQVEDTPEFLTPVVLSPSTFVLIDDDDDVIIIGFERNYIVTESVGTVEICAVVTFPTPDVPILTEYFLSVNTISGTADERDYGRIVESDASVFLQFDNVNRRQCFPLSINNDGLVEDTESLTIDLVFSSFFPTPSSVILDPDVTTVTILGA